EATGNAFWIETVPRVGYRLKTADMGAQPGMTISDEQLPREPAPEVAEPTARIASQRPLTSAKWLGAAGGGIPAMPNGISVWQLWPRVPEPVTGPPGSVAVLPFSNLSGDASKDYFSDGFSEELLNELSNNPQLRVAARTSSFAFKGKNEDVAEMARTLHVG